MKKAIFPGTFDPFHEGHMFVVEESLKIFDKLYILVSTNMTKHPESVMNRVKKIEEKTKDFKNVEVIYFLNTRLTANVARELGCSSIVRGIRNSRDLDYEMDMRKAYETLYPEIAYTIFLATDKNKNISSTLLKEIKQLKENKNEN